MLLATLLLSGRAWILPAAVLLLVALGALIWGYRRAGASPAIHFTCGFLKLLGFAALLGCLLEPLWSGQRARPGANYLAIVADNSQGMQIKDAGQSRSRGDLLRQTLTSDKSSWQGKLEEMFQVRRYFFDSKLQYAKSFSELNFDGRASAIGGSLRSLADRYRGQPLAGVLLFTDGNATDLSEGLSQLSGLPPIYPVVVGGDGSIDDIALQKVTVTQTAFEDAPVSVQADVAAFGFTGREIVGQLIESTDLRSGPDATRAANMGNSNSVSQATNSPVPVATPAASAATGLVADKVVAEQTLKPRRDGDTLAFRFHVRPEKAGVNFYRVRVSEKGALGQFAHPEQSKEATLANNTRVVAVDRGKGPYRVLYVAGRPNWEYKFLHRAIDEDDQVQLDAMIRIAKREPKMDFRGRAGESSNPLFRGFGNQSKDEVEQYDQPVVRWLLAKEDNEVHTTFPKTPEELYRYQAIIIDDLEAEFFTRDQMALVQKFVSERGGGLLMLGGQESFHEGKFDHTPIGDMLPVYLDAGSSRKPGDGYRPDLTREGWLQPWARLRNNEADEEKRLSDVPPFLVLNEVREIKPGAIPIATVSDAAGKKYPALVIQRFGSGRTAALLIGDMWHWGLRDKEVHRDLDKAWRQMVRWLVSDVPNRIELQIEPQPSDPNQAVQLKVRVRDEKFQPMDNATVTISVEPVGATSPATASAPNLERSASAATKVRLTAEPSPTEPGLFQVTYIPRDTGGYFAQAVVTNSVGAEVGRAEGGWSSDPAADEFRSLKPNRALLEDLARKTGGQVVAMNELSSFANSLPNRKVPIAEAWSFPLWHQPVVFLAALACFVAEWGLRRWKGLA